jgi:twitching motility protein PilT
VSSFSPTLIELFQRAVYLGASDLHLKSRARPGFRIAGQIRTFEDLPELAAEHVEAMIRPMLAPAQQQRFDRSSDLDLSIEVAGLARFRVSLLRQRGMVGMVARQIPGVVPTLAELALPAVCRELALRPRGLVLVTGPTGSGKSTALAAMLNEINATRSGHIITLEDPIEYIHTDQRCFVSQREIGVDSDSFKNGLRHALRQNPDVILVGEMRDLETIELALAAAETGHLVLSTLHTTNAIAAVDRIVGVFPPNAQEHVRVQLAEALQGVIAQTLLPAASGNALVAAREILVTTNAVRALIREHRHAQILNLIQTGNSVGMQTLESDLARLVRAGSVSAEHATAFANRPDELTSLLGDRAARPAAGSTRSSGTVPAVSADPNRRAPPRR